MNPLMASILGASVALNFVFLVDLVIRFVMWWDRQQ